MFLDMPAQRSFDDLGTPLSEITFCVVDLETTGGSPAESAITEVGAVKVRRGEVQGTFQTLVNPGQPVPAFIRLLTGLSDEMLVDAPPIEGVLPAWLEFSHDSVLVAHNARFDITFLNAALERLDYPRMTNRVVDTAALARKTLAGEVPNNKLQTLSRYLRCAHQPTHRAYEDALATVDVLHHLIERASGWGVTTLEDLLALSFTRMDATMKKIRLTDDLPTGPGMYRFMSGSKTLYVGKATDLRSRVRSYFYGDPRRKIRNLLRETQSISHDSHATMLEAEVAEARAIASENPPYNRAGKTRSAWYFKVALKRGPRVSAVRSPKDDEALYLGPFNGHKTVRLLIDAVQSATRLHRCTDPKKCGGSAHDEMGTCAGAEGCAQGSEVRLIASAIACDLELICGRLTGRLKLLAAQQRFEEAEELRRRAALLERILTTNAEVRGLLDALSIVLRIGSRLVLICGAQLAGACDIEGDDVAGATARLRAEMPCSNPSRYVSPAVDREARVISSWLRRNRENVEVVDVEGAWALPIAARPTRRFEPREPAG